MVTNKKYVAYFDIYIDFYSLKEDFYSYLKYSRLPNKRKVAYNKMKKVPTYTYYLTKKILPMFPFFHLTNFKKVPIYTFILNYTSIRITYLHM